MHKKLIKSATEEQLREFIDDAMGMLKETHHDLYEDLEMYLYKEIYGCHFNDWMLEKATKEMKNEDGTTGPHWTIDQTSIVAKQVGVDFSKYNEYDWNYVMNMMYSDFYGAIQNDPIVYGKLSKKFLEDKDAREGKALAYYMAMKD